MDQVSAMFYKFSFANSLFVLIFCVYVNFCIDNNAISASEVKGNIAAQSKNDSKIFGNPMPSQYNTDLPPPDPFDAKLDGPQLLRKYGYPLEVHSLFTSDGYNLTLHRLPLPGGSPVVLMHGILCSSRDWLMQRGNNSLPYLLHSAGYDVWLGNMRGNMYSQGHKEFDVNDPRYWDFAVDDISNFDIPSTIDYVLAETNYTQLTWVGYSLGTTTLFSGLITNAEYQGKLKCFVGLAPVAYKGNCKSPLVRALANLALPEQPLKVALDMPSNGKFVSSMLGGVASALLPHLCNPGVDIPDICGSLMSTVGGFNPEQADQQMQPIILGEFPSPISVRVLLQQLQHVFIGAGKFRNYFYQNMSMNLEKYSSLFPPELDLSTFRVNTVLFAGLNDYLAPPEDVAILVEKLPNITYFHNVTDPTWNHLDFIYAKQARSLVYDIVLEAVEECSPPRRHEKTEPNSK